MRTRLICVITQAICLCFIAPLCMQGQERWTFELLGGGAYCGQTPLTIHQSGYDDLDFTAKYATHSLQPPLYYSARLAKWKEMRAWEVELVHLKLELTNKPEEVQHFEISHGYNLFIINRAWTNKDFILRLGAGFIIAHPESSIREKVFDEDGGIINTGYYLSGPIAQAAVGRTFYIHSKVFLAVEGKVTGSYARIPIADGHANVSNVAVHGLFGIGYTF